MKPKKKIQINVRSDAATITHIKQLSAAWGCSQAEVIRRCIANAPGREMHRIAEFDHAVSEILSAARAQIVRAVD